jgi:uncharacterized protein YceH (UPF0502 family)
MELTLNAIEARVLGSLMEKELATPEYYPLSLNALLNACNQKTNRAPVLALDTETVEAALRSLTDQHLVYRSDAGRVAKYWQAFAKQRNLVAREIALLCLLLLRGPQTPGELRNRADNLSPFDTLEEVHLSLENLISTGLVTQLPRQPGQKEQRYAQLLGGRIEPPDQAVPPVGTGRAPEPDQPDRLCELEQSLALLRQEFEALRQDFLSLKSSLE